MNNLLVLAREPAGAALIWKEGTIHKILHLISTDTDEELILGAQRVMDELAKDEERVSNALSSENK